MQIPNLNYIPNFITPEQEQNLVQTIDAQPWLDDLKRCVQHYGDKYDYKARRIDTTMKIGNLPDWLGNISKKLQNKGFFKENQTKLSSMNILQDKESQHILIVNHVLKIR